MKKMMIALSLATLMTVPLLAQPAPQATPPTPPPAGSPEAEAKPPDQQTPEQTTYDGVVDFGFQGVHANPNSGRFYEYRDVPAGGVLPFFRLRTNTGKYDFDVSGINTARTDQRYTFRVDTPLIRVNGDFNQIPHRWGVGHTIEQQTSAGSWEISDTLQQAFQTRSRRSSTRTRQASTTRSCSRS